MQNAHRRSVELGGALSRELGPNQQSRQRRGRGDHATRVGHGDGGCARNRRRRRREVSFARNRLGIETRNHFRRVREPQTAGAILTLAGLDPAMYDLAKLHGDGKAFKDDQQVIVQDGDDFVTVRASAPVA